MLMSHFVTDQVGRYKNLASGGEVLVWSFNIGENKKNVLSTTVFSIQFTQYSSLPAVSGAPGNTKIKEK